MTHRLHRFLSSLYDEWEGHEDGIRADLAVDVRRVANYMLEEAVLAGLDLAAKDRLSYLVNIWDENVSYD